MALPALPLPTGGATHVLEVVTMLAALELVRRPPMPRAARALEEARARHARAAEGVDRIAAAHPLARAILASPCRPAIRIPRHERARSESLVFGLTLSAFLAPPFSGLDTLPSLGVSS